MHVASKPIEDFADILCVLRLPKGHHAMGEPAGPRGNQAATNGWSNQSFGRRCCGVYLEPLRKAARLQGPTVCQGDLAADRQPQPCALIPAIRASPKPVKKARQVFRRDAGALVDHREA